MDHPKIAHWSNWSNIGTFVLTGLILIIMLLTLPHAQSDSAGQSPLHWGWRVMSTWIMPSLLAASFLSTGILNYLAHRQIRKVEASIPSIMVEGVPVDGPLRNELPTTAVKPKLKIHRAVYGAGPGAELDITESLRDTAREGLVIPVDNNLVPRDPAIGTRKQLNVEYSYGSSGVRRVSRMESTAGDIALLVLPEDSETEKLTAEIKRLREEHK